MSLPCQQLIRVITALCDDIATPLALDVKTKVLAGQWRALQELRVDPLCPSFKNAEEVFKANLVVDLLRKCDITTEVDKRAAAVKSFYDCEVQNFFANQRLQRFIPGRLIEHAEDDVNRAFLREWRKEIALVLGSLPTYLTPRFGPGSTFSDKSKLTTIPDKMTGPSSITAGCLPISSAFLDGTAWDRALLANYRWQPTVVPGNRFTTVPKDATKHRGICIEPSLNVSFQLDVGRHIRNRLLGIGIDLKFGQDVHRRAARLSSVHNDFATIDLSNASDTLCRVLPKIVLPDLWFELLDSLRSKKTLIEGKWVYLEKFSSMGNGFTFELETLIFATLARVIVRRNCGNPDDVLVYGDDIIVPQRFARLMVKALSFFGFKTNEAKTFLSGPFRESCGGDFYEGVSVRGHFLKELPNEPQKWITLANGLRRAAFQGGDVHLRWAFIRRAWRRCLDALPSDISRLRGPESLGDIVIHDDAKTWKLIERPNHHKDGYATLVRAYTPVVPLLESKHWSPLVWLAAGLYGVSSRGVAPRGVVSGYRITMVPIYGSSWLPPVCAVVSYKPSVLQARDEPLTLVI